ncbi:MAG TPA: hypothetical protein V6D00_12725 [Pantanalinema sp.]
MTTHRGRWALFTGLLLASPGLTSPAQAQAPTGEAALSGYQPTGAIGTFAWYANGSYFAGPSTLSANAFMPGIAVSLALTPSFSVGAWGMTGPFGGALGGVVGPFTNADLEGKFRLAQGPAGALTGDAGIAVRSIGVGDLSSPRLVGVSPKLGAIFDMRLAGPVFMQVRGDWAPFMFLDGARTDLFDYKLGFGWRLFQGLGVDVGLRGQTAIAPTNTLSLNGPYLGFGYVF